VGYDHGIQINHFHWKEWWENKTLVEIWVTEIFFGSSLVVVNGGFGVGEVGSGRISENAVS
jgi:hypothetical protein